MASNRKAGRFANNMNFEATIFGKKRFLSVKEENGQFLVLLDDKKSIHADLVKTAKSFNLILNNRSFTVSLVSTNNHFEVQINGKQVSIELLSEQKKAQQKLKGSELSGAGTIIAKMPGKIVKILAQVGEEVHDGQSIIIMEAMKMENELKAHSKGVIKEIRVKEGDSVEAGTLLVVLE